MKGAEPNWFRAFFASTVRVCSQFQKKVTIFLPSESLLNSMLTSDLLEEKFQHIASELHPDFYLNSTPQEKRLSERASTLLNQAYDTLKDPFKRADYLMSLKCKNVKWNDRVLPPTFLQEMFTLQEELDEMLENQDQQGLLKMREVLENRFQDLESGLLPSFRMLDSVEEPETVLEKLQMDLNAERYLRRLLDRIKIEETT